ncbi:MULTISPECIES: LysE family translocator [Paenibacillus]|uniref:RhtB (Resistance to homoserine/threonine) family protein n=1 Tax=Paenibacillus pabuli TaxID=1472 RepID=A0A855XTI8_9BACL|nr:MULTISPECIES: LysE family translocator [Paenibacillus]PWW38887.1 RhtB (resistance to homoserine/threonine) family protein [Paenibacillus pabuli]PXW06072.1 RhtB (resistance to homoserine/threonine) family protein [Paenibacillus taichungensis]SEK61896.1 resistance to homoserine/threonine (RhtB) family protein [Paenibacillus sp. OK003]
MNDILAFSILLIFIVMAPGVDFVLITKRTLTDGKKDGFKIALGLISGALVHTMVAALGLSIILMKSAVAFEVIKYAGAAYLIYMGLSSFIKRKSDLNQDEPDNLKRSAFVQGLVSNALNPKVAIFFLTFLPQFLTPDLNASVQFLIMGSFYAVLSILWFSTIVFLLSYVRKWLMSPKVQSIIDKTTGMVLIAFGLNMIFKAQKTGS